MKHNVELQLRIQEHSSMESDYRTGQKPAHESAREWMSSFNTSILTTRATEHSGRAPDLNALMQTPEFNCLIQAAQALAHNEGISRDEATERIITAFRNLDGAWTQLVMKRGLQAMLD
jgi:hypothetical protein